MNSFNFITRRKFLGLLGAISAVGTCPGDARAQTAETEESLDDLLKKQILPESQFGDPLESGDKFETLTLVNPGQQKAVGDDPVFGKKDAKDLADRMLSITRKFADEDKVSRHHKASQVIEFLNILDFNDVDVPFCAAGITYAACRAYCDLKVAEKYDDTITETRANLFKSKLTTINAHYFFPSASVRIIKAAAIKRKQWISRDEVPLPGWLVIYSWDGTNAGNHIGLVESAEQTDSFITTLEYNTTLLVNGNQRDGGHVARKNRPRNHQILGYVKIYDA